MNTLVNTKHGNMFIMDNDSVIGRNLDKYGEWADAELSSLGKMIRDDDWIVDVGANIGTHSVYFAKKAKDGVVFAFEPQMRVFQLLCANVVVNDLPNVVTLQAAVGACCGPAIARNTDFTAKENNFGAAVIVPGSEIDDKGGYIVNMVSVDSLQLKRCDLLKADIEGMEYDMICGAERTISELRPIMYLEAHKQNIEKLCKKVKEFRYDVFLHATKMFNENNFKNNKEDISEGYIETNIVCIPTERNIKTNLTQI